MTLTIGSLFAGVGGIELGLEAHGHRTVFQVEREPYCLAVLEKHWPHAKRHDDALTFPAWWDQHKEAIGHVNIITAGFPCQPFSHAGKQLGTNDERWLWPATRDAIRAVGPEWVLLENVSALVRDSRAFGTVLADLHSLGFDAEWATLRASDFGAPHNRERVYVLAHATRVDGVARGRLGQSGVGGASLPTGGLSGLPLSARRQAAQAWLERQPRVDRLANGIPAQVDRLKAAGNAVVPAVIAGIWGQALAEGRAA